MAYKTLGQTLLVAFVLSLLGNSQGFAQVSRDEDVGTAKRGYGDPLPSGQSGTFPGAERMTIIEAAQSGGVAEARGAFLIGESVNSRNPRGKPALLIAAQAGNIAVVRFLLEKNANPDLFEKATGKTALIAAAERGDSGMIHMLLEFKADPEHQDRQGETALIKAARIGDPSSVDTLLGAGLNVNATDYAGHTARWHAMDARHDKIAKLIQNAGGT
jgi:hypothetical protein